MAKKDTAKVTDQAGGETPSAAGGMQKTEDFAAKIAAQQTPEQKAAQ